MLTRDYKAPGFDVKDTRSVADVQVAGSDNRSNLQTFGDSDWRTKMISQFGQQLGGTMDKLADIEFSNLYLEGQAAAGVVESEDELAGNPLTRDWKVAGYRDTMGKLALADNEAQFMQDIVKLREGNPEDLQAYLAERRTKMTPAVAGMSREARAYAAGQMLLQDRAATKTYTTEHTKFITDQKLMAASKQNSVALKNFGAVQAKFRAGDATQAELDEQMRSTAGTLVGSVWFDNSLPPEVRQKFTFETVKATLANDSVELYDYLARNEISDGQGGTTTLMGMLDPEQQEQLANSYRSAMTRTNDARNFYQIAQVANIEAQLENNTYKGSYEGLYNTIEPMVMRGVITAEKGAGVLKKLSTERYKADVNANLSTMFARGDIMGILNSGYTEKQALDAFAAGMADNKVEPGMQLQGYLNAGLVGGMQSGFERAGQILGVSLRQIRQPDGSILPQHKRMFETIDLAMQQAQKKGNTNAMVRLLSGLDETDRAFASRIFAFSDNGKKSLDEAIGKAVEMETKEATMTPSIRAALAQETGKTVAARIKAIEPMNLLESVWTGIKSVGSAEARADFATRVSSGFGGSDGLWGDGHVAQLYAQGLQKEVGEAASRLLIAAPLTTDPEQLVTNAKADVAARTYRTDSGPIFLPYKADPTAVFGVQPGNVAMIGPAIDRMLKETKADARWHVRFENGKIEATELDTDGNSIGNPRLLNPKDVNKSVEAIVNERGEKANFRYGAGKTVTKEGVTLKYNGVSSLGAGVPAGWMLAFRDNVVQSEGITNLAKPDLSGKLDKNGNPIMTSGIGVSSHNPAYPQPDKDGKITPEEIRRSFLRASDEAAVAGARVTRELGMQENKAAFMLMSELAYQAGPYFNSAKTSKGLTNTAKGYQQFMGALKSGNAEAAKEAFKKTSAWYYSVDPKKRSLNNMELTQRRKHYLNLIDETMKGA